jgi:hypothetical protein
VKTAAMKLAWPLISKGAPMFQGPVTHISAQTVTLDTTSVTSHQGVSGDLGKNRRRGYRQTPSVTLHQRSLWNLHVEFYVPINQEVIWWFPQTLYCAQHRYPCCLRDIEPINLGRRRDADRPIVKVLDQQLETLTALRCGELLRVVDAFGLP